MARDIFDIHADQNRYMDSLLATFEQHLKAILSAAETATIAALQRKLKISDGAIDQTPANLRTLRKIDDIFMAAMERSGYGSLVSAFVGEFPQQFPFLQEILDYTAEAAGRKAPALKWGPSDLQLFGQFQASSVESIEGAVKAAAGVAKTRIMFSVAGLTFQKTVEVLKEALETTLAKARTAADTAMTMFFRVMTDRGFQIIEEDLPQQKQRYRFINPMDMKTRPWCSAMVHRTEKKALTREEIQQYPNGQIPNPFISGGGYNCRGVWILDTAALEKSVASA